jgi:phosphatidylglycerophosphate synthase
MENKKRKDNDPFSALFRRIAIFLVKFLVKTNITPNQITVFDFVMFVPIIIYFFIKGDYQSNLIALAIMPFVVVIDLIDGALARAKSISTPHGAWLDSSLDTIFQTALFVAVTIGAYNARNEFGLVIFGLVLIFGQNMANYMGFLFERDFGFDGYTGSEKFNSKFRSSENKKLSCVDIFLKNIIVPEKFFFIFIFTCRYFLILGILFNRMDLFLITFATTINIRWISMWFAYFKFLSGSKSKLQTIKFLHEIDIEKKIV